MSITNKGFFNIDDAELVSLSSIEEISSVGWRKISDQFSSLRAFLNAPVKDYVGLLTNKQTKALRGRTKEISLPKSIKLIKFTDATYPKILKEIADPPLWLFAIGNVQLLSSNCLAVVGSRKNTTYAIRAINRLLSKDILNKVTIISGLAYGIDKLAHLASLNSNGKTVAVLAGGLDKIYPAAHRGLAKDIIDQGGLLISEHPPGSPATAYKFPIRNRIIAGLSQATIIVEATIKSGTMTTAKSVIDQNRELFVIPGEIDKKSSEGCNYLIAQGATPLLYKEQLINFFKLKK